MTLENIFILSFLLVIVQISIPVIIDLVITNKIKFTYLFSSRDNDQDTSEFFRRANRALRNLYETLPIFIGLVLISIIKEVDNSSLAFFVGDGSLEVEIKRSRSLLTRTGKGVR